MKKIVSILLSITILATTMCFGTTAYASTYTNNDRTFRIYTTDILRPTVLNRGQAFALAGKIRSSKKLSNIKIVVEDLNQFSKDIDFSRNISGKIVDLNDYARYVHFQYIPPGEKLLTITFNSKNNRSIKLKRRFTVLGVAKEPVHITNYCRITVNSGYVQNVLDNNEETFWSSGEMTITLPTNKKVDGLYIKWYVGTNDYTLISYDSNGNALDKYNGKDLYFLHQYYPIDKNAVKVIINQRLNEKGKGIATLRVYEKDKVGVSVEQWKRPKNGICDLMVISCHRDDELLFFGGTIPYYQNVKNKNVCVMYVSGHDRLRVREALAGQWSMGVTNYPIFMCFPGGYHDGLEGTLNDWGGEYYCLEKMVEKLRRYKPKVIVTHDTNGEYGHPSHITTSYLVTKAVAMAKDRTKFPKSYNMYGICQVKKVYKHDININSITMNWTKPYSEMDDKSPFEMACIGFDKHRSQHGSWSMTCDTVNEHPNNKFGLVYTTVGYDRYKNDFFENIK